MYARGSMNIGLKMNKQDDREDLRIYAYTHTVTYVNVQVHVYIYICTYIHICSHICMYTHASSSEASKRDRGRTHRELSEQALQAALASPESNCRGFIWMLGGLKSFLYRAT